MVCSFQWLYAHTYVHELTENPETNTKEKKASYPTVYKPFEFADDDPDIERDSEVMRKNAQPRMTAKDTNYDGESEGVEGGRYLTHPCHPVYYLIRR